MTVESGSRLRESNIKAATAMIIRQRYEEHLANVIVDDPTLPAHKECRQHAEELMSYLDIFSDKIAELTESINDLNEQLMHAHMAVDYAREELGAFKRAARIRREIGNLDEPLTFRDAQIMRDTDWFERDIWDVEEEYDEE